MSRTTYFTTASVIVILLGLCKPESAVASQNKCEVTLSSGDVLNIKKIASTEVDHSLKGSAFDAQLKGVVDTVLNRLASGLYGCSVAEVGNARYQFSAISGLPTAYGSLDKMPTKAINARVEAGVDAWLNERGAGAPSSVGNNLNYLNPWFSSARSMRAWGADVVRQAKASGLIFGAGKAVHFHGTAKGLVTKKPAPFVVRIKALKTMP
jgi:hypothetical protein